MKRRQAGPAAVEETLQLVMAAFVDSAPLMATAAREFAGCSMGEEWRFEVVSHDEFGMGFGA